uniref:Uncharacterized protein n=1 Tax=Timema genevievae TaxID=629358 RepID=A0A7R9JZ13_TIMGE|nr:unnamed protein product [Timema genevievae]
MMARSAFKSSYILVGQEYRRVVLVAVPFVDTWRTNENTSPLGWLQGVQGVTLTIDWTADDEEIRVRITTILNSSCRSTRMLVCMLDNTQPLLQVNKDVSVHARQYSTAPAGQQGYNTQQLLQVNKDVSVHARQYSTAPAEGRRYGKAVITVSQRGALDEEKSEEETEDMEVDDVEPAQKRLRQTNE